MEKWEYKLVHGLSEEELNKCGEEGYELVNIILPPPPLPGRYEPPEHRDSETTVVLKRRKL